MVKVLLIPPVINPITEKRKFLPLGLLTLAATLKAKAFNVHIYHPKKRLIQTADYKTTAVDILLKNPKIIGFSTWCISYPDSLILAEQLKIEAPGIPIVFGGPQASILAKETLHNFPFIDFVLAGEADFSFPEFLMAFFSNQQNLKQISGLTYRKKNGEIEQNAVNNVIENLDDLPIPAYQLVPKCKSLQLDAGRGCPFSCTYCTTSNFFSKKYRVKSVSRIMHEMNLAQTTSKIKQFSFAHDMFTLDKKYIAELCSKMISQEAKTGVHYTWTCSARIDCVSREMLKNMKEAGCESVFFGIESGSASMQKSIGKNLSVNRAYEVADICRETGIDMHASFIMGFPDETVNDLEDSLQCALRLAINGAFVQFSELSILPGTPLYEKHKAELKFDGLFSNFSGTFCNNSSLHLISKYPSIFSSFYYLPVSTLSHSEMAFLCNIANQTMHFRNTLFLLKDTISISVLEKNMLKLFKATYSKISKKENTDIPVISNLIRFLRLFILKNKIFKTDPTVHDVFAFEAFQGLILAQYNRWQMVKNQLQPSKKSDKPRIIPNPVWNLLTTSYKLDKILPSEISWQKHDEKLKKSSTSYLIVAVSPTRCRRFQINQTEEFLLRSLSELTFDEFLKKVEPKVSHKIAILWIKKMNKLGVVEIENPK